MYIFCKKSFWISPHVNSGFIRVLYFPYFMDNYDFILFLKIEKKNFFEFWFHLKKSNNRLVTTAKW
jgi:hypothetical protein